VNPKLLADFERIGARITVARSDSAESRHSDGTASFVAEQAPG
jgi:hypothetical protein